MSSEAPRESYEPIVLEVDKEPKRLAFYGMQIADAGCDFQFLELNKKRRVTLNYSAMPLLIRMTDESYRLDSFERLPVQRTNSIYKVDHSKLVDWFHKETLGVYHDDEIFHIAIVTDQWIDVLSLDLPVCTDDEAT